jgi:cobalt-zinc-cadmium resistance protein CzcA
MGRRRLYGVVAVIAYIVDFALRNKLLVLSVGTLLLVWGVISFHTLPVEAYPDVANNYVGVITQWPGRAAEELEQQVTIPIEKDLSGYRAEDIRKVWLT